QIVVRQDLPAEKGEIGEQTLDEVAPIERLAVAVRLMVNSNLPGQGLVLDFLAAEVGGGRFDRDKVVAQGRSLRVDHRTAVVQAQSGLLEHVLSVACGQAAATEGTKGAAACDGLVFPKPLVPVSGLLGRVGQILRRGRQRLNNHSDLRGTEESTASRI